jgi:hypothetical protein
LELPQAERLYDLLAIYERAALLIAIDSAPLHLAWACRQFPVFALTQDKPSLWHGSSWRPNHLWYCRYHDWPERAVEMLAAIANMETMRITARPFVTAWSAYNDKTHYKACPQALPVATGSCGRDSGNQLKDEKRHPFLKDVLRMAMQRATAGDQQISLAVPGVNISPKVDVILPPYFAYRIEKNVDGDRFVPIVDLFTATKAWWKDALPEIPDFVLNDDGLWSEGLRMIFQKRGAKDVTGAATFIK